MWPCCKRGLCHILGGSMRCACACSVLVCSWTHTLNLPLPASPQTHPFTPPTTPSPTLITPNKTIKKVVKKRGAHLDHEVVLLDHAVVSEAAHGGDGLLGHVELGGGAVALLALLAHLVHLRVGGLVASKGGG